MSSYCAVCRELFDFPHHHHCHCPLRSNTKRVVCTTSPPSCTMSSSPKAHTRCRSSGSSQQQCHQRKQRSSAHRWASSSSSRLSPAVAQDIASPRRSSLSPSAFGAERDTVNSLLRMSPSARASALVRTPSRCHPSQKGSSGTRSSRHRESNKQGRSTFHHHNHDDCHHCQQQPKHLQEDDVRPSGIGKAPDEHSTRSIDLLQATLERIREAVHRDNDNNERRNKYDNNRTGAIASRGGDNGSGSGNDFVDDSGCNDSEGFFDHLPHPRSGGVFVPVDGADGEMSTEEQQRSDDGLLPWSCRGNSAAPSPSTALCGGGLSVSKGRDGGASPSAVRDVGTSSPYGRAPPSSTSHPPAVVPTSHPSFHDTALAADASAAGTRFSGLKSHKFQGSEFPYSPSSVNCVETDANSDGSGKRKDNTKDVFAPPRGQDDFMLEHIKTLRSGFVELCSAVREDLHALHTRMNDLQNEKRQQKMGLNSVPLNQTLGIHHENDTSVMQSALTHKGLLAELQQYTVSTVHKVMQQHMERKVGTSDVKPESSSPGLPSSSLSVPPWLGSPEIFNMHVRSAVRAVLGEDEFLQEIQALFRKQQRDQRCDLKALKREWQRQCAALERQLVVLTETLESTQADVEEVRMQRLSPPPPPPLPQVTPKRDVTAEKEHQLQQLKSEHTSFSSALTPASVGVTPELLDDRVLKRVQRLLADSEERHLQRVRAEIMQPLLEHVRRLMSAHQSMIDTVVESRCAQFEAYVDRGRHVWELQVTDLRSRLITLRGDVHRVVRDLSENLNVACPGL